MTKISHFTLKIVVVTTDPEYYTQEHYNNIGYIWSPVNSSNRTNVKFKWQLQMSNLTFSKPHYQFKKKTFLKVQLWQRWQELHDFKFNSPIDVVYSFFGNHTICFARHTPLHFHFHLTCFSDLSPEAIKRQELTGENTGEKHFVI